MQIHEMFMGRGRENSLLILSLAACLARGGAFRPTSLTVSLIDCNLSPSATSSIGAELLLLACYLPDIHLSGVKFDIFPFVEIIASV